MIVVERVFEVKGFAAVQGICWSGCLERSLTCSLPSGGGAELSSLFLQVEKLMSQAPPTRPSPETFLPYQERVIDLDRPCPDLDRPMNALW